MGNGLGGVRGRPPNMKPGVGPTGQGMKPYHYGISSAKFSKN
jgi:hypothetical protein